MTPLPGLGPVAHIGLVCSDIAATMEDLAALGIRWSTVTQPLVRLRTPQHNQSNFIVSYVSASGPQPRLKLISATPESFFALPEGVNSAVHHLGYWVSDVPETSRLLQSQGWQVEASGLGDDDELGYRYLRSPQEVRIELGWAHKRAEFDAWADADPAPSRTANARVGGAW